MNKDKLDQETLSKWALDVDYILDSEGKGGLEGHARIGKRCGCGACFVCYAKEILDNLNGVTEKELIKENIMKLVKHHRNNCDGPTCDISLYLVRRLIELANIKIEGKEIGLFI